MSIIHSKVASEENKANCDDWNANHIITNTQLYELIEEKDLSEVSTTSFNNLNGDNEKEYLIIALGSLSTNNNHLYISFNDLNINSDVVNVIQYNYHDPGVGAGSATTYGQPGTTYTMMLGFSMYNSGYIYSKSVLYAKSGIFRKLDSKFNFHTEPTAQFVSGNPFSLWKNNSINITSIQVKTLNGSFTGKIQLYKKV